MYIKDRKGTEKRYCPRGSCFKLSSPLSYIDTEEGLEHPLRRSQSDN